MYKTLSFSLSLSHFSISASLPSLYRCMHMVSFRHMSYKKTIYIYMCREGEKDTHFRGKHSSRSGRIAAIKDPTDTCRIVSHTDSSLEHALAGGPLRGPSAEEGRQEERGRLGTEPPTWQVDDAARVARAMPCTQTASARGASKEREPATRKLYKLVGHNPLNIRGI